jgi:hypothetical protein
MTHAPNSDQGWFAATPTAMVTAQSHLQQLQAAERFNGRAAMLGFVIGVLTEALTGQGILHQIGLGTLLSQG